MCHSIARMEEGKWREEAKVGGNSEVEQEVKEEGLCAVHTVHCKLITAHFVIGKMYVVRSIGDEKRVRLRFESESHYTAHCTLHTTHYTLHTTHFTLHTAHCPLPTAHCTFHNKV